MKPLITIIREALRDRLLESPAIVEITRGRVDLNRFEPWAEGALTAIGVYVVSEAPIDNDLYPPPDERKLTYTVEIVTLEDAGMEERLDYIAALVEGLYELKPLDKLIAVALASANEDPLAASPLLKIDWLGNERGYAPEAEHTLGVNIMTFALEYRHPWPAPDLPDFEKAWTDHKATGAEDARVKAQGQVNFKEN